ncbi:MAG TPA: sigma-70 family RNA polymerase sigma factor [Pyrinomonadaceae bacterium]|nr:sigma-70 family RNA polymerase sigma factor [Pyrinomonadaceae bacterium]
MEPIADNYRVVVEESIERLLGRASDPRGLTAGDLAVRVQLVLGKYLLRDNARPQHAEIKQFIDDMRADDLCLVIACERGDERAWEDLVANFDATVRSAARKMSANYEDAEDLASSIWAELYGLRQDADGNKKSKLAYYSGRGSLAGWLRAVVSQLAVDQFRKDSKFVQVEETREFENLANEASDNSNNSHLVSHVENPEDLLTDKLTTSDVSEALASAIEGLEAEDRLILKLYYFDDLKLKDIAAAFGFHEATASRKLVRIQSEIRKAVERELCSRHGWTGPEVKRHLSDTAGKLGINLEQMFAAFVAIAVLQVFLN